MMQPNHADKNFHENLAAFGGQSARPPRPGDGVRARCSAILADGSGRQQRAARPGFRRPALLSGLGLAAAAVLAFSVFVPGPNGATVKADTILAKLTEQIRGGGVFEITLDSVAVDELRIDGRVQVGDAAVAGDLRVIVADEDEPIEVDVAFAVAQEKGWVLLRGLSVGGAGVQPIVMALFPPGSETLLLLPPEALRGALDSGFRTDLDEVRAVASGQAAKFIKEVLRSKSEVGAQIVDRPDGTLLLTITIRDAESLRNLIRLAARVLGEDDAEVDGDDGEELLGATFQVVYDPAAETVRSFSVSNIAEVQGTVTVSLLAGGMDPGLIDSTRVTGPRTRVWDLSAFESVMRALEQSMGE